MIPRIGRLLALPPARRRLLVQALATVVVVRAALSLLPYRVVRPLLDRLAVRRLARIQGAPTSSVPALALTDVESAVSRVSRMVPRATCLTQALATRTILAGAGVPCDVTIGVAINGDSRLRAHAWVELQKVAIAPSARFPDFVPLRPRSSPVRSATTATTNSYGVHHD